MVLHKLVHTNNSDGGLDLGDGSGSGAVLCMLHGDEEGKWEAVQIIMTFKDVHARVEQ